MKSIQHTATLFYYDGPQVFEARDLIGGHYVGVMVEPLSDQDRYLVAGVAPERLRQFRSGTLDLRTLLIEAAAQGWYLAETSVGLEQPLLLIPQLTPIFDSKLLPDEGFVLHDRPAAEHALKEARARNSLILEIAVEPPEAANEHRIRVDTLVGLLGHVQTMVKHGYAAAWRELPNDRRRASDKSDGYLMDVVIPAAAGSFRVVLEAAKTPDLLGQSELARALQRVDELFESASNPQQALATVKAHRGHLAGAYLRLLRFLVQHKTGLHYSWAEPAFAQSRNRSVSEAEAGPLVDVLSGVSNLGGEEVTLIGTVEKANLPTGAWGLRTEDRAVSGKIKEGGPSLEGLKIGGSYKFSCIEEIEEVEGTGREQRTLYLVEHEPV